MAKLSTDELLDAFKEMTLLELSDFVKKFEEGLRGHRGRPVAVAATGAPPPLRPPKSSPVRRHPRGCRREEDRRHQKVVREIVSVSV